MNRRGSFGAKGGVVPPSVFNQLLKCADQIHFILLYFLAYLYFRQCFISTKNQRSLRKIQKPAADLIKAKIRSFSSTFLNLSHETVLLSLPEGKNICLNYILFKMPLFCTKLIQHQVDTGVPTSTSLLLFRQYRKLRGDLPPALLPFSQQPVASSSSSCGGSNNQTSGSSTRYNTSLLAAACSQQLLLLGSI